MIYAPRRFYILMRRSTISHFSFLISHFSSLHAPFFTAFGEGGSDGWGGSSGFTL